MVKTRSSSRSSAKTRPNYSEQAMDVQFDKAMSQHNSPKRVTDTRTLQKLQSRKRKQNDMDDDSEYQPNSGREDYRPKSKKRKMNRYTATPMPQRRSMRLATKDNLEANGLDKILGGRDLPSPDSVATRKSVLRTNNDMVGDSNLDSDDSDLNETRKRRPQRATRRSPLSYDENEDPSNHNGFPLINGHSNGHQVDDDNDGLRRSTRIRKRDSQSQPLRHTPDSFTSMVNSHIDSMEEEERGSDEQTKKKQPGDSDYDQDEFEQDLENEVEPDDAMDDADESDYESDSRPKRRSSRLSKKDQVHYYNDGEAMVRLRRNANHNKADKPQEMKRDKSKSLPLSLRRPKRNRKKPRKVYEESQWEEYYKSQERRTSLRNRKEVNYRESHDETSDETSAGGTTVPSSSSRSTRSTRSRSRSRGGYSRRRKGRALHSRRREYDSSSDESSSCSTDTFMEQRRERRLRKERKKINPIEIHDLGLYDQGMAPSMNKKKSKEGPADISPMEIDLKVDWDMVGGLQHHVQKLKEMVILPLLYPKEFEQFKMSTPKGVLFHGPPGTGKTLVARVLAAQCSIGTNPDGTPKKKVAFYMRKGADCLSKWVGEAERQLRLLFDEAHKNQPAVIFFDEIDGLAPVRSSRQDQIHSSIVSTLLALMDGLDSRGQIIVIGATNRPDAIDPALRRPGRFDRELCFNLPSKKARKDILKIHTKSWDATNCKLDDGTLQYLSEQSVGYCGADLEALCREAFLAAVRRTYPQIYHSNIRLQIDTQKLKVIQDDFEKALKDITPSSQRSSLVYARVLPKLLRPLLNAQLESIRTDIEGLFSFKKAQDGDQDDDDNVMSTNDTETTNTEITTAEFSNDRNHNHNRGGAHKANNQHYRYLIHGRDGQCGQSHLGTAVLHLMEEYPMYSLDLASLYGDSTTKCADEAILRIFKEAQRNTPSVVYWPHVDRWWGAAHDILKTSITLLIGDIANDCPILIVATSNVPMAELDEDLADIFSNYRFHDTDRALSTAERRAFWAQIGEIMEEKPRHKPKSIEEYPSLPIAELPAPSPSTLAVKQKKKSMADQKRDELNSERLIEQDRMACVNLRVYIRAVCNRLCKHFKNFIDQMKEGDVVMNTVSLFEIRQRNNERSVPTVLAFLRDIDQLVQNVKDSAQTDSLKARQFVNEACHLQDQALSMMSQVNRDLVKQCDRLSREQVANGSPTKRRRVSFRDDDQEQIDSVTPASTESPPNNHSQRKSSLKNGARRSDKAEKEDEEEVSVEPMELEQAGNAENEGMDQDDEEESDGLSVSFDQNKWKAMLTKLVKVTKDYNVQELEEKMYNLLRIVYQHSNRWDKEDLMEELNEHISNYFKAKVNA